MPNGKRIDFFNIFLFFSMLAVATKKVGFFISVLSHGMLLIITGTMRCGKSNIAVFLMQKAIEKGYHIYTNIHFFITDEEIEEAKEEGVLEPNRDYIKKHENIHLVTSASEVIKKLSESKTRKNIIILDEVAFFAGSSRGNARVLRWFKELVTQVGKYRASMVLITQVKSELAVMLKQKLPSHEIRVYKISQNEREADIWYLPPQIGIDPEEPVLIDEWSNLEQTIYPYDNEAPAMFEFDFDMEEFLIRTKHLNSIQTRKQASKIIDEMLDEKQRGKVKKISKKEQIMDEFYNDSSLALKALAKKYKTSYQNVKNIHAQFLQEME